MMYVDVCGFTVVAKSYINLTLIRVEGCVEF